MKSTYDGLDQYRKSFGQVELTPEPAPHNPEEPKGNGKEGNEGLA